MTTQAKNRTLAYIVFAMLAFIAYVGVHIEQPQAVTKILIPTDIPVEVAIDDYDKGEFECMRLNVYHEAGNQSKRGKEAIALVVLARMETKSYPSSPCAVVKAWKYNKHGRRVCQFSWYCDGKPDTPNMKNPLEVEAWEESTAVAVRAMRGELKDFLGHATNYHANYVKPGFSKVPSRYQRIATIGDHIFYHDVMLKLKA